MNFEEVLKRQLRNVIEEDVNKKINEETTKFREMLMYEKDKYVEELMKAIRIGVEANNPMGLPRYQIILENTYRIESDK